MDIVVLKFGGSSLANNERLIMVANKIIEKLNKNKILVVVSAQGNTTDNLLEQAEELKKMTNSQNINKRELDMLLSTGEQVSASKLAILLNLMGYKSISLNSYQAGIHTNDNYQNALIKNIDTDRIKRELKENIVIITGFQGIDENNNITTLGRGGSDTTAVALAAKLNAKKCYIYSDVDGIYTADPKKIPNANKLKNISYEEMYSLSSEGAKVLHDRCVEIGEKFNVPIITESTFNDRKGTEITHSLENSGVKSIIKKELSKISVIGYGISSNDDILKKVFDVSCKNGLEIYNIDISRTKISIIFKGIVNDNVLNQLHDVLI